MGLLELNFQNVLEHCQLSDTDAGGNIVVLNLVSEGNAWLSVIPAPPSKSAGNFSTSGQFHLAFVERQQSQKYLRIYVFHKTTTSFVKIMVSSLRGLFSMNCSWTQGSSSCQMLQGLK